MQMSSPIKKLTVLAVLTALGIALQLLESYLPFLVNLPGGKLGLANIVTLIVLYLYGARAGFSVALLRSVLGALLFGGVVGMLYSVSGAVLATAVMYFAKQKLTKLSIVGVSVLGACMHSAAQVCVAGVLLSGVLIYTYLPALLIVATVCGTFTGLAAKFAVQHMKRMERK